MKLRVTADLPVCAIAAARWARPVFAEASAGLRLGAEAHAAAAGTP